jgi:hypothetical protein
VIREGGVAFCLGVAASSAMPACQSAGKREAVALDEAVEQYRRATDPSKDAQSLRIAGLACSEAPICDAKQACVAAVGPTTRALQLKDEVAAAVGELESHKLDPASADAQALPGKLSEAKALLEEGRVKMDECDRKLADLRLRYGP